MRGQGEGGLCPKLREASSGLSPMYVWVSILTETLEKNLGKLQAWVKKCNYTAIPNATRASLPLLYL